jgi:hypothetical protein
MSNGQPVQRSHPLPVVRAGRLLDRLDARHHGATDFVIWPANPPSAISWGHGAPVPWAIMQPPYSCSDRPPAEWSSSSRATASAASRPWSGPSHVTPLFTGLSVLATGIWDFNACRFLCGLGVGGQFAVGSHRSRRRCRNGRGLSLRRRSASSLLAEPCCLGTNTAGRRPRLQCPSPACNQHCGRAKVRTRSQWPKGWSLMFSASFSPDFAFRGMLRANPPYPG